MLSYVYCDVFKNTYFEKHLRMAPSYFSWLVILKAFFSLPKLQEAFEVVKNSTEFMLVVA